jgi:hypothetical protein
MTGHRIASTVNTQGCIRATWGAFSPDVTLSRMAKSIPRCASILQPYHFAALIGFALNEASRGTAQKLAFLPRQVLERCKQCFRASNLTHRYNSAVRVEG